MKFDEQWMELYYHSFSLPRADSLVYSQDWWPLHDCTPCHGKFADFVFQSVTPIIWALTPYMLAHVVLKIHAWKWAFSDSYEGQRPGYLLQKMNNQASCFSDWLLFNLSLRHTCTHGREWNLYKVFTWYSIPVSIEVLIFRFLKSVSTFQKDIVHL